MQLQYFQHRFLIFPMQPNRWFCIFPPGGGYTIYAPYVSGCSRCFSTNFDVSTNESSPTYVRACICESPKEFSLGWYCLAFVDITSNLLRVSARFFLFFRLQHEIHVSEVMVSRWFWQIGSKNVASSRVTTFSGGKKTLGKQNVSIWFHLLKTFTFEIAIR